MPSLFRQQRFHLMMVLIASYSLLATIFITFPSSTLGFSAVTTPRVKDTKVAVDGSSTASVVPPPLQSATYDETNDLVTLSSYMRLPVEQYVLIDMPLGSSLIKLDNNATTATCADDGELFQLEVPEITFFNLTLQPVVLCTVEPMEDKVVIFSDYCYLRGSPFIEKTRLNERFDFRVKCTLTWFDEQLSIADTKNNKHEGKTNRFRLRRQEDITDTHNNCTSSSITVTTTIDVDVDVPRPFSSIPKFILERTGNAAMKLSLKYIQANFVRNLAKDYEKWSTDEEYRSYRASLSSGMDV